VQRIARSTLGLARARRHAARRAAVPLIALAALLPGCVLSSAPSHFYSLAPIAPATPTRASVKMPVQVVVVHVPAVLDRQEIVRGGANMSLELGGASRWGAPFAEMIQRVLTQDLLERLPAGAVLLPDQPAPRDTDAIVLTILEFQSDRAGSVVFSGSWSILPPGAEHPRSSGYVHLTGSASGSDYGDQARVMSELLARVADHIVEALPGVY